MKQPLPHDEWMTRRQVREYLKVSNPTIHRWVKAGRLNKYRVGKRPRFKKADVYNLVEKIA